VKVAVVPLPLVRTSQAEDDYPSETVGILEPVSGPGAFFLTLAISKPCLRPPARCTTSKDLAKASEFWSMLTGLKIFEMIRAGATVKTYIENH